MSEELTYSRVAVGQLRLNEVASEVAWGECVIASQFSNREGIKCSGQMTDRLGPERSPGVLQESSHVAARGVRATSVI